MSKPELLADRLRAELAEMTRQRDEYKRDAERYRWLRVRPSYIGWDWWHPPVAKETIISPEFMDAAIDAALKSTEAQ